MSAWRWTNSGIRRWAMFASEPVSRLSTQMTRLPRRNSSSQRCEPRKPAPPVTRQVDMRPESRESLWFLRLAGAGALHDRLWDREDQPVVPVVAALGIALV